MLLCLRSGRGILLCNISLNTAAQLDHILSLIGEQWCVCSLCAASKSFASVFLFPCSSDWFSSLICVIPVFLSQCLTYISSNICSLHQSVQYTTWILYSTTYWKHFTIWVCCDRKIKWKSGPVEVFTSAKEIISTQVCWFICEQDYSISYEPI